MGIIDSRGRMFGLFSIVDMVCAGIILFLIMGAFRYTHPEKPAAQLPPMPQWSRESLTLLLDEPQISTALKPGMEAFDGGIPVAHLREVHPLEQRCYRDVLLTVHMPQQQRIGELVVLEFPDRQLSGVVIE